MVSTLRPKVTKCILGSMSGTFPQTRVWYLWLRNRSALSQSVYERQLNCGNVFDEQTPKCDIVLASMKQTTK